MSILETNRAPERMPPAPHFIEIEAPFHITSKSNGGHGHWTTAARVAKRERSTILIQLDLAMGSNPKPAGKHYAPAYELRRVEYWGRSRGAKVRKTRMERVLSLAWQHRLNGGLIITLIRHADRPLDDDNLRRGFKAIRDGVADAFGVRDNDPRLDFRYEDRPGSWRVVVRVEWNDGSGGSR